jgi:hypothetical protein
MSCRQTFVTWYTVQHDALAVLQVAKGNQDRRVSAMRQFPQMGRRTKSHALPPGIRGIVARNVAAGMFRLFPEVRGITAQRKALAVVSGVPKSTIERVLSARVGTSIDNLAKLAAALGTSVAELCTPGAESRIGSSYAPVAASPADHRPAPTASGRRR